MALCPFAVLRLLPENETQMRIRPRKVIYHSAVDHSARTLYHYFAKEEIKAESTFYVRDDGLIEQYMDTEVMAHANVLADRDAISVETDDYGDPNVQPWTEAQMDAMIRLGQWCIEVHPEILPQQIPDIDGAGIGYHSMFRREDGTSPWSNARGKTCPGTRRIEQFPELLSGIINGANMPLSPEDKWDIAVIVHTELNKQYEPNRASRSFMGYMLSPLHNGQTNPDNKDTSPIQDRIDLVLRDDFQSVSNDISAQTAAIAQMFANLVLSHDGEGGDSLSVMKVMRDLLDRMISGHEG